MSGVETIRAELSAAMAGAGSALAAADGLCQACVDLLGVDGASVSLMHDGATQGTFGSSGARSRQLDELQFTFGEGPCMDAVSSGNPVLVGDLDDLDEARWPAFRGAVLDAGMGAVFALPVTVAGNAVGALDLFRTRSGPLVGPSLAGALVAAELAALPLLDLMTADTDWEQAGQGGDGFTQLAGLERVEVYQATGMIIGAIGMSATDALIRLRGYAFAHAMTASEVGYAIIERRLLVDGEDWQPDPPPPPPTSPPPTPSTPTSSGGA